MREKRALCTVAVCYYSDKTGTIRVVQDGIFKVISLIWPEWGEGVFVLWDFFRCFVLFFPPF